VKSARVGRAQPLELGRQARPVETVLETAGGVGAASVGAGTSRRPTAAVGDAGAQPSAIPDQLWSAVSRPLGLRRSAGSGLVAD
jgi:hypothetical protein